MLYVTQVDAADDWHARLVAEGFRRIRKLHGKTGRAEREEIVAQWRDGLLDIVVGTSAFGLGIDYPHARIIIHACVLGTLDRFYQEVGRSGRDGHSSLSLIVPTGRDFATAEMINQQQVIGIGRGLRPGIQSNFVDTFKNGSLFNIAHQSRGNSTTTSVLHNRDVVHIDAGPTKLKWSFRTCLNFEPNVAYRHVIGLRDSDRARRTCQLR